jgi:hypothetical protein
VAIVQVDKLRTATLGILWDFSSLRLVEGADGGLLTRTGSILTDKFWFLGGLRFRNELVSWMCSNPGTTYDIRRDEVGSYEHLTVDLVAGLWR